MTMVVFGLSFQQEAESLPPHDAYETTEPLAPNLLSPMTTNFRLAFSSMFSRARLFQFSAETIVLEGLSIQALHCASFRSETTDIHGQPTRDFLLVTVLNVVPSGTGLPIDQAWHSIRSVERKIALLEACGLGQIVQAYSTIPGRSIGQNSFVLPVQTAVPVDHLASIFAFYFLGWITCIRIERMQLSAQLTAAPTNVKSSGWKIADQRLKILNVDRYFLTEDRTNDASLKEYCSGLAEKFKISVRHRRSQTLHREFEAHFVNVSNILQSQQLGSVSNLLLILTVLSVPISFFAAMIEVDLMSDVFVSPQQVFSDYRVYLFLAIGLFAALVPFAMLKIRDLVRSGR